MAISKQDRQLFNHIKKLAQTVQRTCRLRDADLGDLIAWGCEAVLTEKPPQDRVDAVARKAMLRRYSREQYESKRDLSLDAPMRIDHAPDFAPTGHNIVASKEPEPEAERLEDDARQGKEWTDLADTPAADSPQVADLTVYKDEGIVAYSHASALRYRDRQTMQVRDMVKGSAESLTAELEAVLKQKPLQRSCISAFIRYIALRLGVAVPSPDQNALIRYSLRCDLVRSMLVKQCALAERFLPVGLRGTDRRKSISYKDYIPKIAEQYPELTPNELRLAAIDIAKRERNRQWARTNGAERAAVRAKLAMLQLNK